MAMTQQQLQDALEPLLDQSDMSSLLLALGRVCNEKAEHIRINWQDKLTSAVWDRMATKLDKLAVDSTAETLS